MSEAGTIRHRSRPLLAYAVFYLAFLYIPVLFLPLFSVSDSPYISFPITGLTLKWYQAMLDSTAMHKALWNSLKVAAVTSVVSTTLGIFAAKAITRYRLPGKRTLVATIMLPLVIPEIILATSLLILVNQIGLGLSLMSVTFGHILLCVPVATAVLMSRFEGFDRSMEEASADLGENAWWTFWRVTFPMVFPGVLSSLLLAFTISFDEFLMAFFLTGIESTLPMFIWAQLRFPAKLPGVLALGAAILVISFFVIALAEWLRRRGAGGRHGPGAVAP